MTDFDQQLAAYAPMLLHQGDQLTPAMVVYDGPAGDNAEPPYVVVWPVISRPADAPSNSADGLSRTYTVRWILHCVGGNRIAAVAVAKRARAALLDKRPQIAGLECGLIREDSAQQPEPDESTGRLVMDSVLEFTVTAAI